MLAAYRHTDREKLTNKQMDSIDALSRSRYRQWRLNKVNIALLSAIV